MSSLRRTESIHHFSSRSTPKLAIYTMAVALICAFIRRSCIGVDSDVTS